MSIPRSVKASENPCMVGCVVNNRFCFHTAGLSNPIRPVSRATRMKYLFDLRTMGDESAREPHSPLLRIVSHIIHSPVRLCLPSKNEVAMIYNQSSTSLFLLLPTYLLHFIHFAILVHPSLVHCTSSRHQPT